MPSPKSITFLVPGQPSTAGATRTRGVAATDPTVSLLGGEVTQSVVVSTQRAAGGREVPITAVPGRDLVVMHVDGGPMLVLHPENARDLMLAQGDGTRASAPADAVSVPARLQWRGLEGALATRGTTRGFLGDVMLRVIEVVSGKVVDKIADFGASAIVKKFDAQVNEGVYRLSADSLTLKDSAPLDQVPPRPNGPILVLVHGTFSTTSGTFGKLWTEHPQRVRELFRKYDSAVYALDHATLGASPIDNALTLARALPAGADVHLLTHSRGGLVAEVLARLATDMAGRFEPFAGKDHQKHVAALKALVDVLQQKGKRSGGFSVDVSSAWPARREGRCWLQSASMPTSPSSSGRSSSPAIPVAPQLVEFLGEVARRRADPETIPGLAAQIPDSPLVQWLHEPAGPADRGRPARRCRRHRRAIPSRPG